MPESKIVFENNEGFWIHEIYMQLVYCYIYTELSKSEYSITKKDDMLYSIKFHIDGWSTGIMALGWFDYVQSKSDKKNILSVLENTKSMLQLKGDYIEVNELQNIKTEDEDFKLFYRTPFPISELIKVINALIEMVEGVWNSTNYNMEIKYK
jgi:hypothetical protein